jgi:hypothetical protein
LARIFIAGIILFTGANAKKISDIQQSESLRKSPHSKILTISTAHGSDKEPDHLDIHESKRLVRSPFIQTISDLYDTPWSTSDEIVLDIHHIK